MKRRRLALRWLEKIKKVLLVDNTSFAPRIVRCEPFLEFKINASDKGPGPHVLPSQNSCGIRT